MDSNLQPAESGNKTPVEDRSGTNSQERGVSDAEEVDFSDPGSDVDPQTCEDDTIVTTKGDFCSSQL